MKSKDGFKINQYCYQGCMKRQDGLQINQYYYQGCMKRQERLEINHAILLSGFYEELGRVGDKPILL